MPLLRAPDQRSRNPFVPGFNQVPDVLAGRREFFASLAESLEEAAYDARTPRPLVLMGSRGVGKTVLLTETHRIAAEELSWLGVHVEMVVAREFTPALVDALVETARLYRHEPERGRGRVITGATISGGGFGVSAGLEVTLAPQPEERRVTLETALDDALAAADITGAGLVITLDELQYGDRSELQQLGAALQARVPRGDRLVLVAAGLPGIQDPARIPTYFERGEWLRLTSLTTEAAIEALAVPAQRAGRPMTDQAAAVLAAASGGYPYAVQLFGRYAWRASDGHDEITVSMARDAVPRAEAELERGLYGPRWAGRTAQQQRYLSALAALATEERRVIAADVARALGREPRNVSYMPERLERHGLLYTEPSGQLQFALPGFGEWIRVHHRFEKEINP